MWPSFFFLRRALCVVQSSCTVLFRCARLCSCWPGLTFPFSVVHRLASAWPCLLLFILSLSSGSSATPEAQRDLSHSQSTLWKKTPKKPPKKLTQEPPELAKLGIKDVREFIWTAATVLFAQVRTGYFDAYCI